MSYLSQIKDHQIKLQQRYTQLIEEAYNLRQTDHAMSDDSEYRAMRLLNKINQLKFLERDNQVISS